MTEKDPAYNPGYGEQAPPPPYSGFQYPAQQQYPPQQDVKYGNPAYPPANVGMAPPPGQAIGQQPQAVMYVQSPLPDPPNDHLCFNIIVTICCCWPIGIFAILKSVETRDASNRGDRERALVSSRAARKYGLITLVVGLFFAVLSIALTAYYLYVVFSQIDFDDFERDGYD